MLLMVLAKALKKCEAPSDKELGEVVAGMLMLYIQKSDGLSQKRDMGNAKEINYLAEGPRAEVNVATLLG